MMRHHYKEILSVLITLGWYLHEAAVSRRDYLNNDNNDEELISSCDEEEGEDLISQLPDDVLLLIIGRIPTGSAVSTSILSKRWMNLYKSLTSIQLSCTDLLPPVPVCKYIVTQFISTRPHPHKSKSDFEWMIYRLDRFLRLHSNIRDFYFQTCNFIEPNDHYQFQNCIYYLGKSGIEKLKFHFHHSSKTSFSCDLVCEFPSLKYLGLGTCCPKLMNSKSKWNSLTTLVLTSCTLVSGFLECILSNCLNLESLIILGGRCPPKLRIRGGTLKTLRIEDPIGIEEIELHASNLCEFELSTIRIHDLVFDYVPKLETMYMNAASLRVNMMAYIFGQVAQYVPGLKFLSFATHLHKDIYWMGGSRFNKLRKLDVTVPRTPIPCNLLDLIPYLGYWHCPLLEELQLNLPLVVGEVVVAGAVSMSNEAVIGMSTNVKKVEINGFRGTDNEIKLALYILKTASSLHQMCIIRCHKERVGGEGGCGRWAMSSAHPWSEKTLLNINLSLRGQALSPTAKLSIRHRS